MFEQVKQEYERRGWLTPAIWSPLTSDIELWHRLRLFFEIGACLRRIPTPIETLRVLDIGCGVGRSTRAWVEFGILPEHLVGVDFQGTAIDYAVKLNPAIEFKRVTALQDIAELGTFDVVCQCTVFSSINEPSERSALAETMSRCTRDEGYIFWWDLKHANSFAGGDRLLPERLFDRMAVVYSADVPLHWEPHHCVRPFPGLRRVTPILDLARHPPTHEALLFQKIFAGSDGETGHSNGSAHAARERRGVARKIDFRRASTARNASSDVA